MAKKKALRVPKGCRLIDVVEGRDLDRVGKTLGLPRQLEPDYIYRDRIELVVSYGAVLKGTQLKYAKKVFRRRKK